MLLFFTTLLFNQISAKKNICDNHECITSGAIYTMDDAFKIEEYNWGCFHLLNPMIEETNIKNYIFKTGQINMNCHICKKDLKNIVFYALINLKSLSLLCCECYNSNNENLAYEAVFYNVINENLIIIMPDFFLLPDIIICIRLQYLNGEICNIPLHFKYINNNDAKVIKTINLNDNNHISKDDINNGFFCLNGLRLLYKRVLNDTTVNNKESMIKIYNKYTKPFDIYTYINLKEISKIFDRINNIKIVIRYKGHDIYRGLDIINLNINTNSILKVLKYIDQEKVIRKLRFSVAKNTLYICCVATKFRLFKKNEKLKALCFLFLVIIIENEQNKTFIDYYNYNISKIYNYLIYRANISKVKYFYYKRKLELLEFKHFFQFLDDFNAYNALSIIFESYKTEKN